MCPSFTGRDVVTHSELVGVAHTDTVVQAVLHVLRQLRTVLLGHLARQEDSGLQIVLEGVVPAPTARRPIGRAWAAHVS